MRSCRLAATELCVQRCFIATSFKEMRAGSYGTESKKLIAWGQELGVWSYELNGFLALLYS